MKIIYVLILLLSFSNSVFSQDRIDTLYYTQDWKYAPNKLFADFYRIVYYPADSLQIKQYRDFFITGELQGRGNFIKIDSLDDKQSVFEGECVNYFKNGKFEAVANYKNGVLDGEFRVYEESGALKKTGMYINGLLSGIYTEYLDSGTYVQINYFDGEPKYDYYTVFDAQGNMSKFKLSDNTPLWETPLIIERKSNYNDGVLWQVYNKNGIIIALTNSIVKNYGRWYRIDVVISNNGVIPFEFDPSVNISAKTINVEGLLVDLDVWSYDDYMKKVRRSQNWESALAGVSEGLSTANAGKSTSTTYSKYGYYQTTTYNESEARRAREESQKRITELDNNMMAEREIIKQGYLKRNTINPGETISGYVHLKRIKGDSVWVVVNIKGAEYLFDWENK